MTARLREVINGVADGAIAPEVRSPEFSDDALAMRFSALHARDLRFVAAWGKWLKWNGLMWQPDETVEVFDMARAVCRAAASECNKRSEAKQIAGAKARAAVENLARGDRRHASIVEDWDLDDFVFNASGVTVNLSTGESYQPRREDYCTKIGGAAPDGKGHCPLWLRFLDRITASDVELQRYLQRLCGYSLTGSIKEHSLHFFYGTGANGKTTFVNTLSGILHDYCATSPIEMLMASPSDRHPTELARLRGCRLTVAVETEEGRHWAESRIKYLTGGESRISARFMHRDFFEFEPKFKLLVVGNNKPSLRSVDAAIRRRFHLVPFVVTIPKGERDEDLPEKLKAEWPGILQWMIDGCLEWRKQGLSPPAAVRNATEAYLLAEDSFAQWLEECTRRADWCFETTNDLYASYKAWSEKAGERQPTMKKFSMTMEERGYAKKKHPTTRRGGFEGIELVRHDYTDDPRHGG